MAENTKHLNEPVLAFSSNDFTSLNKNMKVSEAFQYIREKGVGEKIIYFYVVDENERLVGVLPTRRILTAALDQKLEDIMIPRVVAIPHEATLLDACEFFVLYKFLAFPIVDEERRILGVVDVNLFTQEVFDIAEHEQMDEIFKSLGFKLSQVKDASPLKAFRFRFPWLLATVSSGVVCALLSSLYEVTLAQSIILAFFLTLILGLGESVSIQSMTVTMQVLRNTKLTMRWYLSSLWKEATTSMMLGAGCGITVAAVVLLWRGDVYASITIGGSIFMNLCVACIMGLSVPSFLHSLKLDPKIAAGPVTLAIADICTLLIYFNVAKIVLQ